MTARRPMAVRRGEQWRVADRPSRLRPWALAVAWAVVIVLCGVDRVSW